MAPTDRNRWVPGAGFGTYEAGVVDYWQIVDPISSSRTCTTCTGTTRRRCPTSTVRSTVATFITYENPQSLQYKLDYIKDLWTGRRRVLGNSTATSATATAPIP